MFKYVLANTVPNWVSASFPYIQGGLLIIIALCAIAIIVAVLVQPSNPEGGNNAITGKNESYYSYNKGDTKEGRLNKVIVICAIVILVCALIYLGTAAYYNGLSA